MKLLEVLPLPPEWYAQIPSQGYPPAFHHATLPITRYVRGKCTILYQSQLVILGKLSNVPKIIQMSFFNGSWLIV